MLWSFAAAAGTRPLLGHAALVVGQAALPIAGLLAMQRLVDAVADGIAGRSATDVAWRTTLGAVAFAAVVALAGNVLRATIAVLGEGHGRRLADLSSSRVQEHAARVDLAEFDRAGFHDLLQRAGGEAAIRPVRLVQDLAALLAAAVAFGSMAVVLGMVEPWLPLVVGGAACPLAWVRRRHARLRFAWGERAVGDQRDIGWLGAALTGRATAKDVRVLRLWPDFGARLGQLRAGLRDSLQALARRRATEELGVHVLAGAALFGAYLWLGHAALGGALTIGGLVLQAQAVQRAQNGVRDLLSAWSAVAEDRLFLQPLVEFFAIPPRIAAVTPVVEPAHGTPPGLSANDVSFRYPGIDRLALENVAFRVGPGERLAVVGANGSGKSTLVKLLCRLYDPTTGALSADDRDLRHVEPERWRSRVACLLQDAAAFELTLRENLTRGHASAVADAALWRALTTVGLADRVRALPLGLATPLSRRHASGVDWSGGELRRLLLARALAQPADVLLLDEPFAQLDAPTAAAVAKDLTAGERTRTVIVVDHRRTVLSCVDRVLVLERGRVVAFGAPADLLAREPRLSSLFPDP